MSFWDRIHEIAGSLDSTSYYQLLGVAPDCPGSEILSRYYAIAGRMHPDRYAQADKTQLSALSRINARLNEARRILSDAGDRSRYDSVLKDGLFRLERGKKNESRVDATPSNTVAARLYEEARSLLRSGDREKAQAQLELALRYQDHEAIRSLLASIDDDSPSVNARSHRNVSSALDSFLGTSTDDDDDEDEDEDTDDKLEEKKSDDLSAEDRQSERHRSALPVRINIASQKEFQLLYSRNISTGGMFIECDRPLPPQSPVEMTILAPTGESIRLEGQVAHRRSEREGHASGMGISFTDSDDNLASVRLLLSILNESEPENEQASLERLVTTMLKMKSQAPHEVLGILVDTDLKTAGEAYAALARAYHPVRNAPNDPILATAYKEIFLVLRKAYEAFGRQS